MIALVGKNNAIVMAEKSYKSGQYKLFTAGSSMAAGLLAMEYLLNTASDNTTIDKEVLAIYIPDTLKGFAGKAYVDYIRTGKTASGRAFTAEERELVLKVATLLCTKGLNVRATESKYMTKDISDFRNVVLNTAKDLKINAPAQNAPAQSQPQVNPNQKLIDKLQEKMAQALDDCDLDLYDKLEEKLLKLTGVQASAPATEENAPAQNAPQKPDTEETVEEEIADEEPEEELNVDEEIANLDC